MTSRDPFAPSDLRHYYGALRGRANVVPPDGFDPTAMNGTYARGGKTKIVTVVDAEALKVSPLYK